ncbi:MAG: GNAT family N-acetyltransferase [Deltaproteobacteria bacterium]|nr:GNAT family N-acetyltransferase [Deltaproteobacteria bacterium]
MSGSRFGPGYLVGPLEPRHDRRSFSCRVEALDRYLKEQATQDARRGVASVFVAEEQPTGVILGYYTLSMAAVNLDRLPDHLGRKMPRYPTVPCVRLGRLAIHADAQGHGLGTHLLMDAMARALRSEIAWAAFLVDAKDEAARSFYLRFGFESLADDRNHLYLMRRTLEPLFGAGPPRARPR